MRTITKFFSLGLLILFSACKKDPNGETVAVTDYLPLKPGNYWIYDEYKVDALGAERQEHSDSCYVEKDTVIAGKNYYKLVLPGRLETEVWYLRDSLKYIVSNTGRILFASEDFSTEFHNSYITGSDTIARVVLRMTNRDFATSTPAGVFKTSSLTRIYQMYPAYQLHGPERRQHRRFARGVGIVTDETGVYYQTPEYLERRLVRYKIQ